ncbi:hypothetical protein ACFOUV_12635 [Oceanobacillus longus]|uniref:Fur-regulated basic protein FbpA n=1 Tax=Oceanobacillus longus TaxID=930120 RepID=A0ABV8H0S8_9BACI
MMENQLRMAVEEAKKYYIRKLSDAGILDKTGKEYTLVPLSELEQMYKSHLQLKQTMNKTP